MISKLIKSTSQTLKQTNAFKNNQLVFIPQRNFFGFGSKDCYQKLNISKNATKDQISTAYHTQLRQIHSQSSTFRKDRQISDIRQAYEEAMRNLNKRQDNQQNDQFSSNYNSQSYQSQQYQNNEQQQQQQFQQNNQPKRGWFKEFLLAQSYGQKPNEQQKQWGMELFILGILGVTGVCYLIGTNLKDHSKYNQGPRVIMTAKDLEIAKQQHKEYKDYMQQQRQIQQQNYQQQPSNEQNQSSQFGGDQNNENSSKSQFEREFEEYKNKSSSGIFGKDE